MSELEQESCPCQGMLSKTRILDLPLNSQYAMFDNLIQPAKAVQILTNFLLKR